MIISIKGLEKHLQERAEIFSEIAKAQIVQPIVDAVNEEWGNAGYEITRTYQQLSANLKFSVIYEITSRSGQHTLALDIEEQETDNNFTMELRYCGGDNPEIAKAAGVIDSNNGPSDPGQVVENILKGIIIAKRSKRLHF